MRFYATLEQEELGIEQDPIPYEQDPLAAL